MIFLHLSQLYTEKADVSYVDSTFVPICIPYINGKTITFSVASTSKGSRLPLTIIVSTQSGSKGIIQMNVLGSNGAPINWATVYGSIGITSIIYTTDESLVTTYTITIDTNGWSICQVLSVNPVTALVTAITEGTSIEFEYQNPPMAIGVEYRTTERCMGKPVYRKYMEFQLSATTSSDFNFNHGISNIGVLVDWTARVGSESALPRTANGYTTAFKGINSTQVRFSNSGQEWSTSYIWAIELAYTKTTD